MLQVCQIFFKFFEFSLYVHIPPSQSTSNHKYSSWLEYGPAYSSVTVPILCIFRVARAPQTTEAGGTANAVCYKIQDANPAKTFPPP